MTSPYPPPSNQPGGDGWGGDLNSPFGQAAPGDQVSPFGAPPPGQGNESQEPSPYEGVQYELEAQTPHPPPQQYPPMSGPPSSGPPGYGPPPPPGYGPPPPPGGGYPPQPPQKSGSNTGLIVGGVIAGVVILMVLAVLAVFVIVDDSGGSEAGGDPGGGEESSEEGEEETLPYRLNSDPCGSVKSDVEDFGEISGGFDSNNAGGNEFGYANCYAMIEKSADDYENYGFFSALPNVYETPDEAQKGYETAMETEMSDGCETSELSGAWEQGTAASCSYGGSEDRTVIAVHDANIEMAVELDVFGDLGVDDPQGALESIAEKVLEDLKE